MTAQVADRNYEIAVTIIEQMGGMQKLQTMVSARNLVAIDYGLQFNFFGNRKINQLVVRLDPMDTYTVEFWKIYGLKIGKAPKMVSSYDGIYFDMIITLFEKETGLCLRL